jgi:hypothetical protein
LFGEKQCFEKESNNLNKNGEKSGAKTDENRVKIVE